MSAQFLRSAAAAATVAMLAAPAVAHADEVRLGFGRSGHDLVIEDEFGKEQGLSVTGEYLFDSPSILRYVGSPRPYVGAMVSLDGYTNFLSAGLNWRASYKRVYMDVGGGAGIHDGNITLPQPEVGLSAEENERRRQLNREFVEFGRRVLFNATLTAGYRVTDHWAVEIGAQHWSNGNVHSAHNDGSDILHLRTAYRF
ncbi:MAG TPA: acyloxyacyl hydrolase [Phenylobacterium sp.]